MGSVLSRVFGSKKEDSKADVREPKHRKRWSFRATRRNDDSAVSVPARSSTLPARAHQQVQDELAQKSNEAAAQPQRRQSTEFEEIDEDSVANRVQEILKDVADDEDHEPVQSELHASNTTESSQVLIKPVEASALVSAALGETLDLNEQKLESQVAPEAHLEQGEPKVEELKVDEIQPELAEQSHAINPEAQPHDEEKEHEVQHEEIEPVVQEQAQAANPEEYAEQEPGHEDQAEHAETKEAEHDETKEAEHETIEPVVQEHTEAANPEEHQEHAGEAGEEGHAEQKPEGEEHGTDQPENPEHQEASGEAEHAESEQHEPTEEVHVDQVEAAQLEAKPSNQEHPDSGVESHQESNENEGEQHHEESQDQGNTESGDHELKSDIDKPAVDAFVTDILTEAQHQVEGEPNHEQQEGNDAEANHTENENPEHKDEEHSGKAGDYDDELVERLVEVGTNEDFAPNHEENNNHETGENPEPILEKSLNPTEEPQLVSNGDAVESVANGYQE